MTIRSDTRSVGPLTSEQRRRRAHWFCYQKSFMAVVLVALKECADAGRGEEEEEEEVRGEVVRKQGRAGGHARRRVVDGFGVALGGGGGR